jgi:hypothetical protein
MNLYYLFYVELENNNKKKEQILISKMYEFSKEIKYIHKKNKIIQTQYNL